MTNSLIINDILSYSGIKVTEDQLNELKIILDSKSILQILKSKKLINNNRQLINNTKLINNKLINNTKNTYEKLINN